MSTATVELHAVSDRQGWRSLYWMVPIAAAWVVLTFLVPSVNTSDVSMILGRLTIHVIIPLGLWVGLERVEMSTFERRAIWLAVMIPWTLWVAVAWSAAVDGFFNANGTGGVPPLSLIRFLPTIIFAPILLRSRRIGQVLDVLPAGWLIGLQVFRLQGALWLLGWVHHTQPPLFAVPAGIADVSIGVLSVPIAFALAAGSRNSRWAAIAWNVLGLTDYGFAIMVNTSIGLHLIDTGFPAAIAGYPAVMISAVGVPQSIVMHLVSLRQLLRRHTASSSGAIAIIAHP